ncbi:MAG: Rrf2 family transcriptional regulator [Synergistaceae bacterium]|nr:Rrf2 family transcriptional regulator [Synergistaceae bacterium]
MAISQKCQYALRAIYELALHQDEGPCKIGAIAEAQSIPVRFLENILNSLKGADIVDSARGKEGGYYLLKPADSITVGEVIRFVQGPLGPVECTSRIDDDCDFYSDCVFRPLWDKAREALERVYDGTTFQDLVDQSENICRTPQCSCNKKKIESKSH